MIDPERPEAKQAVTDAHSVGIRPNDNWRSRDTAEAICFV